MHDLYESTHANVQLANRDGYEALYIEKINGPDALRVSSPVGWSAAAARHRRREVLLVFAPTEILDAEITAGLPHTPRAQSPFPATCAAHWPPRLARSAGQRGPQRSPSLIGCAPLRPP